MQKIKQWFWIVPSLFGTSVWIVLNLLGMSGYLWLASFLWLPLGEETIIYGGSPGAGGGVIVVPCMTILLIFLVFNFIVLRHIRVSKNNTMLFVWFAFAGLWLGAVIYDGYRSPIVVEFPDEITVQTPQHSSK